MRFTYDKTKLQLSNIKTNEISDNVKEYFEFEDEFKNSLDLFTIYNEDSIKMICSFNPPVDIKEGGHIIEKEGIGKVVNTNGGVLLGKMSFQMTEDIFDMSSFKLVEDTESSPLTGIKINTDGLHYFDNQRTFRFANNTASKDANLTNIIVSSEEKNEENPEESSYKEYNISPEFNVDTKEYELKLLDYIDNLNIKATQSDEKASMKVIVPKRDEEDNLIYDTDGTEIIYEEKEIKNNIPLEIKLNKIGEEDTIIKIIVTAEDKITTKEYTIVIKRPYGTLKGRIHTKSTETTTGKYIAKIRVFKSEEIAKTIDWAEVKANFEKRASDDLNEKLSKISKVIESETNDDGTYEINLAVGNYDILIDKSGYLDHIYTNIEIKEDNIINKETKELIAGDVNKDGNIQIKDKAIITQNNGRKKGNAGYTEGYDLNNDGIINLYDKSMVTQNNGKKREIE